MIEMEKIRVHTEEAPAAIGTYSQAILSGRTVYLLGQIPLDPSTQELIDGDIDAQIRQVVENLAAVARAAGAELSDIVKLTVYLTDLGNFPRVNEVMSQYFEEPYPARAAIGVVALPKAAAVEMDAILVA